jgi:lipid A ethanolaminephosphotransferase
MTSLAAASPVKRLWRRPRISSEALIVIVAAFLVCADNVPLWRAVLEGRSWSSAPTWGYACGVFLLLVATYYALLAVCAVRTLLKPVLIASLIAGAAVAYYVGRYNVVFDAAMMSNVLHTDAHEAVELVDAGLLTTVLIAGIIPSLFVMLTSVRLRSWPHALAVRAGTIVIAMIVAICALLSVFQTVAPLVRNRHEIRHLLTPLNLFSAAVRSLRTGLAAATTPADPPVMVSRDMAASFGRPTLFVLVIGETARSANFSLNGYARETNPELSKLDIINFPYTRACGTSTEVSVPCMFSPFGRRSYDEAHIARHESLVQQIAHAGIRVVWRDNQSGCKGVCAGVEVQRFDDLELPGVCTSGRCFDEVLLRDLDTLARGKTGDVMLVLHQIGNHGPAYYRRYPPQFKHFEPACETDVLHNCTQQQIVNAYDNALRYTDHVLAQLIAFLQTQRNQYDVALIYVSDHGESLGERGLYLHGMPYAIAPREQLEVPMIWWLSPEFAHNRNIDVDCLRTRARDEASHDHLFHSITGVLGVKTADRDQAMDLFAQCRGDALRRAFVVSR